ncbi:MAG: hypothetical protein PW788_12520 [Micavibrio sp.]|nr:hypothetical protein [Micavibrio sp.]
MSHSRFSHPAFDNSSYAHVAGSFAAPVTDDFEMQSPLAAAKPRGAESNSVAALMGEYAYLYRGM